MQTHGKNTADFVFQVPRSNISAVEPRILKVLPLFQGGSSSLLATAGHSADGRNVALWDTLLPQRKACVTAFKYVLSSTMVLFCLLLGCRDLGLGWSRWFVFIPDNNFSPSCHDAGAACLAHATQHQLLLSAGKKGLVRNRHAKAIWVKSYTHTLSTLTHAPNICHFCYTYTFWPKNA